MLHDGHKEEVDKHFDAVNVLFSAKEYGKAGELLKEILKCHKDHPRALHGLGVLACEKRSFDEARNYFTRALEKEPNYSEALNSMGNLFMVWGNELEARSWYVRALETDPNLAVARFNLGLIDVNRGGLDEAVYCFEQSLILQPEHFPSLFYLGIAKMEMGKLDDAFACFEKANLLDPSSSQAWCEVATIHQLHDRAVDAEETCIKGLEATNNHPSLKTILGMVLLEQGRITEAEECHRSLINTGSQFASAYSTLMFTMNYNPKATQEEIYSLAVTWGQLTSAGITRFSTYSNNRDPGRPLRIGYVSGDFRTHPVGFHLLPVFRNHDRKNHEIYCYYNSFTGDDITREFMGLADTWRGIANKSDADAAKIIRDDGIDILVDLSGHTSMNRLSLFARKPAPVQATWLGYFNTTGITAIDYLISDDATILPGEEGLFTEKVMRLPWSRFCFTPYSLLPDLVSPPCLGNGYVTFGSFNNLAKLNPEVIALWAKILRALPDSRLILKRGEFADLRVRQRFSDLFSSEGVSPDRLDLRTTSPYDKMLQEYGEVDIALDPFPFSGGLTTLDALLMGVPVVTMSGKLPISRQTRAFYRVLNLLELVTRSQDRYFSLAIDLAQDTNRLQDLKKSLRTKLMNSYLCNGREFTRNLEKAYRTMWQDWCDSVVSAQEKGA